MRSFRLLPTYRLFFALLIATLFASGLAQAQTTVPFKAAIAITEMVQPTGTTPCVLVGVISGTGMATHLGKVTLDSTDCIIPISATAFLFSSNQVVFTVSNGDQVFATYGGILTIEGTVGAINGGFQIEGGTGRYAQATGAGIVQGVEELDLSTGTGKGEVQLIGTISY